MQSIVDVVLADVIVYSYNISRIQGIRTVSAKFVIVVVPVDGSLGWEFDSTSFHAQFELKYFVCFSPVAVI